MKNNTKVFVLAGLFALLSAPLFCMEQVNQSPSTAIGLNPTIAEPVQQEVTHYYTDSLGDFHIFLKLLQAFQEKGALDDNWNIASGHRMIFIVNFDNCGMEYSYALMKLKTINPGRVELVRFQN